jgi:hypothetical protein
MLETRLGRPAQTVEPAPLIPEALRAILAEDRESLNVMVIYDGVASRNRAARAETRLRQELGSHVDVFSWWGLRFLQDRRILELASERLRQSDVVWFALHRDTSLPLGLMKWIDCELGDRARCRCALLLLLELGSLQQSGHSSAHLFLHEVARTGGIDLLFDQVPDADPLGHTMNHPSPALALAS